MGIIEEVLFGALGGVLLPQDPVPVKTGLKPINPEDDPSPKPGTILPRFPDTSGAPNCRICRLVVGALTSSLLYALNGYGTSTGFFEQALMSFAAGAVGSNLIGNLASLFLRRR